MFTWVLQRLADAKLVLGRTVGIDATTLEANAAMRSIVRRDTGESYDAFLTRLPEAIRGARGKRLLRQRGELLERPNAHLYDTGGMRRVHLRGHSNIVKRLLVHVCGFNAIRD